MQNILNHMLTAPLVANLGACIYLCCRQSNFGTDLDWRCVNVQMSRVVLHDNSSLLMNVKDFYP
eukprot:4730141-Amphidinium_carterae.3